MKQIARALIAMLALTGLVGTAAAPVVGSPAAPSTGTGPKSVSDPQHVFTFTASRGTVDVGETFYLTMHYENKGTVTIETGFGYIGALLGTYVLGSPTGDTFGCSTLLVEAGCTWPLVAGGDEREITWPVTVLAMPPDGRITFTMLVPGEPQEVRLAGVTLYNLPALTVDVH